MMCMHIYIYIYRYSHSLCVCLCACQDEENQPGPGLRQLCQMIIRMCCLGKDLYQIVRTPGHGHCFLSCI